MNSLISYKNRCLERSSETHEHTKPPDLIEKLINWYYDGGLTTIIF